MQNYLIYIFLLINFGHFITAQCNLPIVDLEKITLKPIWAEFCNSKNCFYGDTAIKIIYDSVRISAIEFKSLVHTNQGLAEASFGTPKSQNMLEVTSIFTLGNDDHQYNLIKSCTSQNVNGKNQTQGEFKIEAAQDQYQIFSFSTSSGKSNGYILMFKSLIFVFAFCIIYV